MIIRDIRLLLIIDDKGILLLKFLLKRYGIKETAELALEKDFIIISPNREKDGKKHFSKCTKTAMKNY